MKTSTSEVNQSISKKQPEQQTMQIYEIPVEGSLGLLAVGAKGLLAWREKRAAAKQEDVQDE